MSWTTSCSISASRPTIYAVVVVTVVTVVVTVTAALFRSVAGRDMSSAGGHRTDGYSGSHVNDLDRSIASPRAPFCLSARRF